MEQFDRLANLEQFVRLANLERFTNQIASCPAGPKRETLLKLLTEEIARNPTTKRPSVPAALPEG